MGEASVTRGGVVTQRSQPLRQSSVKRPRRRRRWCPEKPYESRGSVMRKTTVPGRRREEVDVGRCRGRTWELRRVDGGPRGLVSGRRGALVWRGIAFRRLTSPALALEVRAVPGGRGEGRGGVRQGSGRGGGKEEAALRRWCGEVLRREAGTATVWVLAVIVVLWAVVVGVVVAGGARVARHRVQAAADLTALAVAAQAVPAEPDACRHGEVVAAANRARLVRCAVVGAVVDVVVASDVRLPPLGLRTVTARARAGPATSTPGL